MTVEQALAAADEPAPPRVEIVGALLRSARPPISGPAGNPSSSPRRSGSAGSPARDSAIARSSSASPPANRAASSAHGSVARRKRWIARGDRSGGSSAKQLPGIPPQLIRDRQLSEPVSEDRDEPHVGRRVAEGRAAPASRRAARAAQLVQALEAHRPRRTSSARMRSAGGFVTSPAPAWTRRSVSDPAGSRARPRGGLRAAV